MLVPIGCCLVVEKCFHHHVHQKKYKIHPSYTKAQGFERRKGGCKAGTGFGILADTAADNIITATVSDWGMNALMACTAFLLDDVDLFHTEKEESAVMDAAAKAGMLDMYGEARPYIDGIGKNIVLPIISLMRGLIEYPHTVEDKTDKWFETTIKKGYFK